MGRDPGETLRQAGETAGRLTDPLGWRAAAEAFDQAERAPASGERTPSPTDRLREVADLHKEGILSDEEFASAKAKLLGGL